MPAFHPKVKGTSLDDFLVIDLPDHYAARKEEVLVRLQRDSMIKYGEFNDIIQIHPVEPENVDQAPARYALPNVHLVKHGCTVYFLCYEYVYNLLICHR